MSNLRMLGLAAIVLAVTSQTPAAKDPIVGQTALKTATDAYLYGYPLVTMEMTRRVMTNVAKPEEGKGAPMGQFLHMRKYPTAAFQEVTAPNADTLYSTAWLDLSREPYIFGIPAANGRYYLMPMLDAWTNVFQVPGSRTTGEKPQKYAITGPRWKGTLPAGVTAYRSPTNIVWILGRTYCTGTPEDYKKAHLFQDGLSLVPLSSYGKPYTAPAGHVNPSIDMKTAVRDQVNRLGTTEYFTLIAELMKSNPPVAADAPMVAKMARIGIVPGKDFDATKLAALQDSTSVPQAGMAKIAAEVKSIKPVNGWIQPPLAGLYGTQYLERAAVTFIGLGANRKKDAVYPTSEMDAAGHPYTGANRYVIHFGKGELPPVKAFWSLTMYNDQWFFVDNPLNRYDISQRNKLKFNADGSLDLYVQADNPGPEKVANWLPAPKDKFMLMMRLYWPKEKPPSILDGTWQPPAVKIDQ